MPYPTVAEIRLLEPDVADVSRYPSASLQVHLDSAIQSIEGLTRRAFAPTPRTESGHADRDGRFWLERGSKQHVLQSITTVSVTPFGAPALAASVPPADVAAMDDGELLHNYHCWAPLAAIAVTYQHGLTVCPADIVEVVAMATRLAAQRPKSAIPDKADRFVVGGDSRIYFLDVPGLKKLGVRSIDAVLSRHGLGHGMAL